MSWTCVLFNWTSVLSSWACVLCSWTWVLSSWAWVLFNFTQAKSRWTPVADWRWDSIFFRWTWNKRWLSLDLSYVKGGIYKLLSVTTNRFASFVILRTVPTFVTADTFCASRVSWDVPPKTAVFLRGVWPCGKSRSWSWKALLESKKKVGVTRHFSGIVELKFEKKMPHINMYFRSF